MIEQVEQPQQPAGDEKKISKATSEVGPYRQAIRDLPLPPEIAEAAKDHCRRHLLWSARSRGEVEEEMKLRQYYGGKWIAYLRTDKGLVVVAVAERLSDPIFDQQLAFLTDEERRHRILERPSLVFDDNSEILSSFLYES